MARQRTQMMVQRSAPGAGAPFYILLPLWQWLSMSCSVSRNPSLGCYSKRSPKPFPVLTILSSLFCIGHHLLVRERPAISGCSLLHTTAGFCEGADCHTILLCRFGSSIKFFSCVQIDDSLVECAIFSDILSTEPLSDQLSGFFAVMAPEHGVVFPGNISVICRHFLSGCFGVLHIITARIVMSLTKRKRRGYPKKIPCSRMDTTLTDGLTKQPAGAIIRTM